jgi:DNA-binding LytR/AlgR family response regulator
MNEFEARLDPDRFRRIHRSHIVNLDHVASLSPAEGMRYEIVMRDGSKILASRTRSRELRGLAI